MDINGMIIRKVAFPLMEKLKGNSIRGNLEYLKGTQHLKELELIKLQEQKLCKLLIHCIDSVPAYYDNKEFRDLIEENPIQALKQFPVLSKQHFRMNSNEYLSINSKTDSLISNRTGGSTGEPVKFYLDRYTVEFYEAARWRGLSWHNINIGDSSAMIWGSPIELNKNQTFYYKYKERFLKNRIIISAYDLNPNSLNEYIHELNGFKPSYIYGYASAVYMFAKLMMQYNKKLNFIPKAVISTAETLHEFQRDEIEKAFKCMTVNEYGARDGGIISYQCPKGEMHISSENVFIEIVDVETKESVSNGNSGLILVTDLNNFSMPRLRYQLGDIAEFAISKCGCGLNLPVLGKIQGREDDIFVSLNGSYIHGHFFNHIARNLGSIKQFQITQRTRTNISLKIIKSQTFNENDINYFKEEIIKAMGNIDLALEFVDNIPLSGSGKIRYAIREFPI